MRFSFFNHRGQCPFSPWVNRAVYVTGSPERMGSTEKPRQVRVKQADEAYEAAQRDWKKAEQKLAEQATDIQQKLEAFNSAYDTDFFEDIALFFSGEERVGPGIVIGQKGLRNMEMLDAWIKTLETDVITPGKNGNTMRGITKTVTDTAGREITYRFPYRGTLPYAAYQALEDLLSETVKPYRDLYKAEVEKLHKAKLFRLNVHGERLTNNFTLYADALKLQELYRGQPAYDKAMRNFKTLADRDEFIEFWQNSEGDISGQRARETRQLFFTVLAENTNGFENGSFLLGKTFAENAEENRKNHPFVYREWLNYRSKGLGSALDTAQKDVEKEQGKINAMTEGDRNILELIKPEAGDGRPPERVAEGAGTLINDRAIKTALRKTADDRTVEVREQGHNEAVAAIKRLIDQYESAKNDKRYPKSDHPRFDEKIEKLAAHQNLHEKKALLLSLTTQEVMVKQTFTRSAMEGSERHQRWLMETLMRKFQKAVQMVEKPMSPIGNWSGHMDARIRRMMIAMAYRNGVGRFELAQNGTEIYNDDLGDRYFWLLSQLVQSPHFNQSLRGKKYIENPEKIDGLLVGYFANLIKIKTPKKEDEIANCRKALLAAEGTVPESLPENRDDYEKHKKALEDRLIDIAAEKIPDKINPLGTAADLKKADNPKREEALQLALALRRSGGDPAIAKTVQQIWLTMDYLKAQEELRQWKEDAAAAEAYFKNPASEESRKFIERMRTAPDTENRFNKSDMEAFALFGAQVESGYNLFDLKKKSRRNKLEYFGINIESSYEAYLEHIKKNPDMRVDKWNDHFAGGPEAFGKLVNMLDGILASNTSGGKEDFLIVFRTLNGNVPGQKPSHHNAHAVAFEVYTELIKEMASRDNIERARELGKAERDAKRAGMNVGEKAGKYVSEAWEMLTGSGQPFTNRLAAGAAFLMAFKFLKRAWKGGGPMGKFGQLLIGGVAAEILLKQMTGRGLMDRANIFDSMGKAMEGTYEAVLTQQGRNYMESKGITEEEHSGALGELNPVPFDKIMAWYNMPEGREKDHAFKKLNLNPDNILANKKVGWAEEDKLTRAKHVVRHTVQQFFDKVANKDDKYGAEGAKILKERWVTRIQNPDFDLTKARFTEFDIAPELLKKYRKDPRLVSWYAVLRAEIDPSEVEQTKNQTLDVKAVDAVLAAGETVVEWGEEQLDIIYNYVDAYLDGAYIKHRHDVKEWIAEMTKAGARNFRKGADGLRLTWNNNEYHIRKFWNDSVELVTTGIKLPFQLMYGVHQWAVPRTTAAIRATVETLKGDSPFILEEGDGRPAELTAEHIKPDLGNWERSKHAYRNPKKNPMFKKFGIYQPHFHEAFKADPVVPENPVSGADMFYVAPDGIAYFISKVTRDDVGFTDQSDSGELLKKMNVASMEKAERRFLDRNESGQAIKDFMTPIHFMLKKGPLGIEKMYTFWRMPLKGSVEAQLKEMGRWTGSMDATQEMDHIPFRPDRRKNVLENLRDAYGLNGPLPRELGNTVAMVLAKWFQMGETLVGGTANLAHSISDFVDGRGTSATTDALKKVADTLNMEESTREMLDIYSSLAGNPMGAASKFFRNPAHAKAYQARLDFAQENHQDLYLFGFPNPAPVRGFALKQETKTAIGQHYSTLDQQYDNIEANYLKDLIFWKTEQRLDTAIN